MRYSRIVIGILTILFAACQQEEIYTGPCNVRISTYLQDEVSVTRGYTAIGSSVPAFTAELFVSDGASIHNPGFTWNGSSITGNLQLEQGTYHFYGYMPKQDGATFDPTTKTMHLPAIPGVSATDAMVINPQTLTVDENDQEKTVTLKMDHLMAKITPRIYLNSTYAQMRSIKIKKVEFWLDGGTNTHSASVTYTDDSYSIAWSTGSNVPATRIVTYETTNPVTLTTTKGEQAYGYCYLCPNQLTENLKMRVTYDVYDTANALTRENAVAENQIKRLTGQTISAGTNYKLNIQIVPTYLYSLSDNDEESLVIND